MKKNNLIACFILLFFISGCIQNKKKNDINENQSVSISKEVFGKVDGQEVYLYTLKNSAGLIIKITNYGGIVTAIFAPDKTGHLDNIVLGYENLGGYLKDTPYFGAIVGRYANRIAKGKFVLDGQEYNLAVNNGPNHLHGGLKGFDIVVWNAEEFQTEKEAGLKLNYLSVNGEEGYPGNLGVKLSYTLTSENELKIEYTAISDKPSPINLSHHSYFNLAGTSGRDILDQKLMIDADKYTLVDETLIPTGELRDVTGAMDFRQPMTVGSRLNEVPGGYDHNYVLNNNGVFAKVAQLSDSISGRTMEVFTDEPGLQFYSGNFLDGSIKGSGGNIYRKHSGLCLETQHFPDSPNHPEFPNTILRPGEEYKQKTVYKFGIKKT